MVDCVQVCLWIQSKFIWDFIVPAASLPDGLLDVSVQKLK